MTSRDRDFARKYVSGSSKRKKCAKRREEEHRLSGSLSKYLKTTDEVSGNKQLCLDSKSPSSASESIECELEVSCECSGVGVTSPNGQTPVKSNEVYFESAENMNSNNDDSAIHKESADVEDVDLHIATDLNVSDPFLWPEKLSDSERSRIVEKGPVKIKIDSYPVNKTGRHFSDIHFTKILTNGEKQERRWLVYSESNNSVHCFACRLFSKSSNLKLIGALGSSEGLNDWKHLSEKLKSHENNKLHKECMVKWLDLSKCMSGGNSINALTQAQLRSEHQRWKDILERLLAIVQFLSVHNLPFRGHEENLIDSKCGGNFFDLVKLIARFDHTLQEHLRHVIDGTGLTKTHYLSKTIQNEFIELMANHVKSKIIETVQQNKYFSIILDCTRDISRIEQLSVIIRIANKETANINEYFLGFIAAEKTTGEKLADYIINQLSDLGLSLSNCRGQGYDNGANMRGEKSGVQKRLLDLNPLAFFVPCGSHSWNLVLGDAASSCPQAQTFFGLLQRLYTIFAGSSERWSILKSHVDITLKPLSETRWECRIESVKAVRYQLSNVCEALTTLRERSTDCGLISECQSLENEISSYDFVVSLVVWYDILLKIHTISKVWQNVNMHLDAAVQHLETFINWLKEYRLNGFVSALITAREVADEASIDPTFKIVKRRRKKKMFSYEKEDEVPEFSPEDNFKINYFFVIVDAVQTSLQPRFNALNTYKENFGFMYHIKKLQEVNHEELMNNCKELELSLSDGDKHDIDAVKLREELEMLSIVYNEEQDDILAILKYIIQNSLSDVYPNVCIALRIIATIPVTVASAERSFSKLKLIKTYLRSTMSQHRLSSLSLLSIENELTASLDFSEIIEDFSRRKSRKVIF